MNLTGFNAPRVSVALSFRNSEQTLALAVRSILSQTFDNFELLLCDDNSSDNSLNIASSFTDDRVIVWSDGLHKGLGARLNECILKARGEYLLRMDADDVSYPNRIQREVDFLDAHPEIDLVSTFALVFKDDGEALGKLSGPTAHADITRRPLMNFPMWHPTWAGRVAWFKRYLYRVDAPPVEDQELLLRAHRTSCYAVIPEILLGYRQNGLSVGKLVKARRYWWRAAGWHLHGVAGWVQRLQLGAVLTIKISADCIAIWSGLGYRLLRHRARPLSETDQAAWNSLWLSLTRTSLDTTTVRSLECGVESR